MAADYAAIDLERKRARESRRQGSHPRSRWRDVVLQDGTTDAGRAPAHWRRVALIVARMTGKRVGVDAATRVDWHFMVRLDSKAKSTTYVRPYCHRGRFI